MDHLNLLIETAGLDSGVYKITVDPRTQVYQGLASTSDLVANPPIPTFEETVTQFGIYIGVAATIIGVIAFLPQLRNYFSGRRQRGNMAREMNEVNNIYDRLLRTDSQRADSAVVIRVLIQKRDNVLTMFRNNQISQEQYGLLDGKISEYVGKLPKARDT